MVEVHCASADDLPRIMRALTRAGRYCNTFAVQSWAGGKSAIDIGHDSHPGERWGSYTQHARYLFATPELKAAALPHFYRLIKKCEPPETPAEQGLSDDAAADFIARRIERQMGGADV